MNRRESQKRPEGGPSEGAATQWQHLRELLIGPEQDQLAQVLERLNDPVYRAEELSQALPDAITVGASRDNRIARALQPTIDEALKRSANANPKAIADAIFPALGPAIRKAISAALMGMIQSLNQLLNQSFSIRGLKWRLEAIRTKKPFAEVVLLHTLVYRVEQIFLIHRQSGILLQHVGAENDGEKDPDLVSGMLTAIQEFVKDSFDTKTGEMLDTLRMSGDHSVWIEQGRYVMLAAVIRGIPPLELRQQFRDLLGHIHSLYGAKLDHFQGKTSALSMIKPDLEDALAHKARKPARRFSPLLWLLMAGVLVLAVFWAWRTLDAHRQWTSLLAQIRAERGIVVTMAQRKGGQYIITGLRDPLARDVETIFDASGIDRDHIHSQWQPFYALDEDTTLKRARLSLKPPPTVTLTLSNGTLKAGGKAPHQWVEQFRRQASTIPGIQFINDAGLQDIELNALRTAIIELQQQAIYFDRGQWRINDDQAGTLKAVLDILERIRKLNQLIGLSIKITIIGQTDPRGSQALNLQLSQRRAQVVLNHLIQNGIDPAGLQTIGATVVAPLTEPHPIPDYEAFRSVTFKVSTRAE